MSRNQKSRNHFSVEMSTNTLKSASTEYAVSRHYRPLHRNYRFWDNKNEDRLSLHCVYTILESFNRAARNLRLGRGDWFMGWS